MQRMDQTQAPDIELRLTHNRNPHMPRNFFVHLFNMPQGASVRIEYDGQDLPVSLNDGYADARFWVAPDKVVNVTILKENTLLASGAYLVHDGSIFEGWGTPGRQIPLRQVTHMSGDPG